MRTRHVAGMTVRGTSVAQGSAALGLSALTFAAFTFTALSCAEKTSPGPSGSPSPARDDRATAADAALRSSSLRSTSAATPEAGAAGPASTGAAGTSRAKFDDYVVSGPYGHANLAVYLVHGEDRIKGKTFLTLEEALAQKKVTVHETGNVSELAIENVSLTEEVYVQSGDIVKGGKQDRVIAHDFIVPAKSGKMPIASFCVEQGRWRQRGGESVAAFSESNAQLATRALKYAAKKSGSQEEVWQEVAAAQRMLAANVSAGPAQTVVVTGVPDRAVQEAAQGGALPAAGAPQALENRQIAVQQRTVVEKGWSIWGSRITRYCSNEIGMESPPEFLDQHI